MEPVRTFLSYSSKDKDHVTTFRKQLAAVENGGHLVVWWDTDKITAGDDWEQALNHALGETELFLAVLSADYFSSDWCTKELNAAKERGVTIIPILLKPVTYQFSSLSKFDATPDKGNNTVIGYPGKTEDAVWAHLVIPDIFRALPKVPRKPLGAPDPPPPPDAHSGPSPWKRLPGQDRSAGMQRLENLSGTVLHVHLELDAQNRLTARYQAAGNTLHSPRPAISLDDPFADFPLVNGARGFSAMESLLSFSNEDIYRLLGDDAPARLGAALFILLFGAPAHYHPVFAALFGDDTGSRTTPVRDPVRCRLHLEDPRLCRLPWRLTFDPATERFLTDIPWTFEIAGAGPSPSVDLTTSPHVLVVAPLEAAESLGTEHHIDQWREVFCGVSEKIRSRPTDYFTVVHTYDDFRRAAQKRQPKIVYYYGRMTSPEHAPEPQLMFGNHHRCEPIPFSQVLNALPSSVSVCWIGGYVASPRPCSLTAKKHTVPCVIFPSLAVSPEQAQRAALDWFSGLFRRGIDPIVALHNLPEWDTHGTLGPFSFNTTTSYDSWTTPNIPTRDFRGYAQKYLDRDDQRSRARDHLEDLIGSPRRVEVFVAYGDQEQHLEGFGELLTNHLKDKFVQTAAIRHEVRYLPAPPFRGSLLSSLSGIALELFGNHTDWATAFRSAFPKAALVNYKQPVVVLDWGVLGTPENPAFNPTELTDFLKWHTQTLAGRLGTKTGVSEVVVIGLLRIQSPEKDHETLLDVLEHLQEDPAVASTLAAVTPLRPLERVRSTHVLKFLQNPHYSSCGTTLAQQGARKVMKESHGIFKQACDEIDKAEEVGWTRYLQS